MSRQTRRTFLKKTAATGAGLAAGLTIAGTKASGRVLGANDTIRLGVAGINGRGGSHISAFSGMDQVQVTHLIDPDSRLFPSRTKAVEGRGGNTPKCVQDIRQALDDKELDAVSVATCNHWHSLITIWSCLADKDVYVEKPCSHNPFEGRKCVEAARAHKRIVQHGTQSRGSASWARIVKLISSGKYGKLLVSKAYASKSGSGRWSIGYQEPKDPPEGFDFDLWLGPAPLQPYHGNIVHYNWHWFWDFGNGEIGNQGVHQMDIARWGIPAATLPKTVIAMGGRWVETPDYKDQAQTPNMQLAVMDFGGPLLVFEVRGLVSEKKGPTKKSYPGRVDNEFYLEEGAIIGNKFYPRGKEEGEALPEIDVDRPTGDVFANFIECVRTRQQEYLMADILEAHYSAALCHLANISYRLGRPVPFGQGYDALGENDQVRKSVETIEENLQVALGMDLSKQTYTLGPKLDFDAQTEKFVGSAEADKLLTRDYRAPYVIPPIV